MKNTEMMVAVKILVFLIFSMMICYFASFCKGNMRRGVVSRIHLRNLRGLNNDDLFNRPADNSTGISPRKPINPTPAPPVSCCLILSPETRHLRKAQCL